MNDEQNQSTPLPEPNPLSQESSTKSKRGYTKGRRGALEGLPEEIKKDMEEYMRKVNPRASQRYMIEKYGEQFPIFKVLNSSSFNQYFKRHNTEISRELELQKQSACVTPEIKDIIEKFTDPNVSLEDKKGALVALYNACAARNELLLARQTNFLDPYFEKLIGDNRKEQHAILKTVITLQDQLSKESDKDFLGELKIFTQVLFSSVKNTYQRVHQSDLSKFSEFMSTLSETFKNDLKSYRVLHEQIAKKGDINLS